MPRVNEPYKKAGRILGTYWLSVWKRTKAGRAIAAECTNTCQRAVLLPHGVFVCVTFAHLAWWREGVPAAQTRKHQKHVKANTLTRAATMGPRTAGMRKRAGYADTCMHNKGEAAQLGVRAPLLYQVVQLLRVFLLVKPLHDTMRKEHRRPPVVPHEFVRVFSTHESA